MVCLWPLNISFHTTPPGEKVCSLEVCVFPATEAVQTQFRSPVLHPGYDSGPLSLASNYGVLTSPHLSGIVLLLGPHWNDHHLHRGQPQGPGGTEKDKRFVMAVSRETLAGWCRCWSEGCVESRVRAGKSQEVGSGARRGFGVRLTICLRSSLPAPQTSSPLSPALPGG